MTVFTDIPGYHEALGCKISLWQPSSISFLYVYFGLSYMGIHFTCCNATNVIKYTNIKLICLTFLIFHFFHLWHLTAMHVAEYWKYIIVSLSPDLKHQWSNCLLLQLQGNPYVPYGLHSSAFSLVWNSQAWSSMEVDSHKDGSIKLYVLYNRTPLVLPITNKLKTIFKEIMYFHYLICMTIP